MVRNLNIAFSGGEVSPEMLGRIDDRKYQTGAAKMRNMIAKPHGPAMRRPGFKFMSEVKTSARKTRLIPFTYSTTNTLIIEMGHEYFRFLKNDGTYQTYTTPTEVFVNPISTLVSNPISGNTITTDTDHFWAAGVEVVATMDASPTPTTPTGLTEWSPTNEKIYWTINTTDDTLQLAETEGGPAITISGGVGILRLHRYYRRGDIVLFTNNYICRESPLFLSGSSYLSKNPGSSPSYWYQLPTSPNTLEIPGGYQEEDLFDIHYVQSGNRLTFTHPGYNAIYLERISEELWRGTQIDFGSSVTAPLNSSVSITASYGYRVAIDDITNPSGTDVRVVMPQLLSRYPIADGDRIHIEATGPNYLGTGSVDHEFVVMRDDVANPEKEFTIAPPDGVAEVTTAEMTSVASFSSGHLRFVPLGEDDTNYYQITAVDDQNVESEPTTGVSVKNNLFVEGAFNTITWGEASNASEYRIYKRRNGLYGYIGKVDADETLTFKDDNIGPDLGVTPPIADDSISISIWPATCGFVEQRQCFAATDGSPQKIWMSRSGTDSDMSLHLPVQADDRIAFELASREVNTIRHIIPMDHLILLTSGAEYRVTPLNEDALTPTSISARPQSYVGASNVKPILVDSSLLFCGDQGGHLYQMNYQATASGFVPDDVSLRANHLFDTYTIDDLAFGKAPMPIVWCVSSSGSLLGLTYVPQQQVWAWHEHTTDGTFESCAVIRESGESVLYVVVKRTVDGNDVRYIEKLDTLTTPSDVDDCIYLDSAITYDSTATTSITGLDHLEGETVSILADGVPVTSKTVTSGAITLDAAASTVQVGLPYTSQLQTLPVALNMDGFGSGRRKNVNKVWIRVTDTGTGFEAGPTATNTRSQTVTGLVTGEYDITVQSTWADGGQLFVQQSQPLPLTVLSVSAEVSIG